MSGGGGEEGSRPWHGMEVLAVGPRFKWERGRRRKSSLGHHSKTKPGGTGKEGFSSSFFFASRGGGTHRKDHFRLTDICQLGERVVQSDQCDITRNFCS